MARLGLEVASQMWDVGLASTVDGLKEDIQWVIQTQAKVMSKDTPLGEWGVATGHFWIGTHGASRWSQNPASRTVRLEGRKALLRSV